MHRRLLALLCFTTAYLALSLLDPAVALGPAFLLFLAGSAPLMLQPEQPVRASARG
jgi:hypothetical protein